MARLSDRVVVALQCQAISWAILLKVAFRGKPGNRNWLISRIRETSARRIIRLCTKRGSRALTGGGSNACAATWPWRGGGGVCALSMPTLFPSRSKRRGRMGPAISCCLRWNCWRSWRLWSPRPGFISCATTGSWRPGPGPATASCRPKPGAEPAAADGAASAASCGHRLRWATLLARVFSSDLSQCAACGRRLRIVAALTDPTSIRIYLEGVGLPAMPPPRAPPQPLFEFAA